MKLRVAAAFLLFAPAAAAEPCLNVRGPLDAGWSSAVRAAESELAGECGKATLTVTRSNTHVLLEMVTPDGRRGERLVDRPRELVPTALGLVASIPEEPLDVAEPPPEAPAPKPPPAPMPTERSEDRGVAATSRAPSDTDRLASLGLTFGTRLGLLPSAVLSTDVELRGDVRVGHWLVALSGRASPSGSHLGGHDDWEYSELSVGIAGGRMVELGGGQLALSFGPRLLTATIETDTLTKSRRDLVLQAAVRYVAPFGGRLRPALAFETEATPLRITTSTDIPSWSTSLRFGIVAFGP